MARRVYKDLAQIVNELHKPYQFRSKDGLTDVVLKENLNKIETARLPPGVSLSLDFSSADTLFFMVPVEEELHFVRVIPSLCHGFHFKSPRLPIKPMHPALEALQRRLRIETTGVDGPLTVSPAA